MPDQPSAAAPDEIVELYGAAWNERDEHARRALLERCWAPDAIYTDPSAVAEGRDALVSHIGGFHDRMREHSLELTSTVDAHHGWLRFGWRMLDGDGAFVMEGMDLAQLGADGLLLRIVGFFGPPPA